MWNLHLSYLSVNGNNVSSEIKYVDIGVIVKYVSNLPDNFLHEDVVIADVQTTISYLESEKKSQQTVFL